MMNLIIDTTNREVIRIGLSKVDSIDWQDFETQDQSADILEKIDELIKTKKKVLGDLRGILINLGPGSFTGVRVGVATANALAWSLNIPVIGYRDGDVETAIKRFASQKHFSGTALPFYHEDARRDYPKK